MNLFYYTAHYLTDAPQLIRADGWICLGYNRITLMADAYTCNQGTRVGEHHWSSSRPTSIELDELVHATSVAIQIAPGDKSEGTPCPLWPFLAFSLLNWAPSRLQFLIWLRKLKATSATPSSNKGTSCS